MAYALVVCHGQSKPEYSKERCATASFLTRPASVLVVEITHFAQQMRFRWINSRVHLVEVCSTARTHTAHAPEWPLCRQPPEPGTSEQPTAGQTPPHCQTTHRLRSMRRAFDCNLRVVSNRTESHDMSAQTVSTHDVC